MLFWEVLIGLGWGYRLTYGCWDSYRLLEVYLFRELLM